MGQDLDVKAQSQNAYRQWCHQWRAHAKEHSKYEMLPFSDLQNQGIGRPMLLVANGWSFEENIDTIVKYKDSVDIMCCDKSLKALIDRGVEPKYCLVCDANVSYEKYLKPVRNKLQNVTLIINVCANPKWTANGNWKGKYFFVNQDVMQYEREFMELSGCKNLVIAGTNVSNALVIMATQSTNEKRRNFMGYDKYLLVGFDYCWRPDKKYYAFDEQASGKYFYMRHVNAMTLGLDLCYTSNNLLFSAQWLEKYIQTFDLPVVQCTTSTILSTGHEADLEQQIKYSFRPEDAGKVREMVRAKRQIIQKLQAIETSLAKIAKEHYYSYVASV